jgi:hypothetical protein
MAKLVRFADLPQPWQLLVRAFQSLNYGQIQKLEIRAGQPDFSRPPVILADVRLDTDDEERPEVLLQDFVLRDELTRMISRVQSLQDGTIERIDVRAGVPRRIVIESRLGEALR